MIALTHMGTHSDIRLAENVPEVDLILGGHSKVYDKRRVGYSERNVMQNVISVF